MFAVSLNFLDLGIQTSDAQSKNIMKENEDVFKFVSAPLNIASKLGKNGVHKIILNDPDRMPVKQNPYRMSPYELEQLKETQ
jgi:hypothetical protein